MTIDEHRDEQRHTSGSRLARLALACILALTFSISGCGGGGGGDDSTAPPPPPPPPPPPAADTDGDGLSDAEENTIGTSPILADTDGDGLNDNEEVTSGGFNPLVADLPKISISIIDAPTIQLDVVESASGSQVGSYTSSYTQGQQSSYARSDTSATSTTVEASTRVYEEVEASAGAGGFGGSAKAGSESSVSASATQENSTSITQTSAQDSRETFGRYREDTNTVGNVTESGSLTTTLDIRNIGSLTFELARVEVIAKKRAGNGSTFQPVGTLRFEPDGGPQDLGPSQSLQKTVTTDSPSVPLLKELMENPSGLLFTVSNYEMDNVGAEDGRNFARLNQDVSAQTAQIVIDYGDTLFDGSNSVEQYMVASNVERDTAGDPVGVTVAKAMNDILDIPFATIVQDVLDQNGQPTGEQRRVLSQVRNLASQTIEDGFWYVFTSSDSMDDPATDFEDILLKARDRISMVYLKDSDSDGIFDREEYLLGTNPGEEDTDQDGLTDFEEAKDGWSVNVDGRARAITSDPLNYDVDQDNLSDLQERDLGTDPSNADTDGDGTPDDTDVDPTGASLLAIDVQFTGPTSLITATGSVVPPAGVTLQDVVIDWGDGSADTVITKPPAQDSILINSLHQYANDGNFTITLTARSQNSPDETRTSTLSLVPQFAADIGNMLLSHSWNEEVDTRVAADINGDGRTDLVGFGIGGVWTALGTSTGFSNASNVSSDFGSDLGFNKNAHRRQVVDVSGDGALDLVMLDTDGVYVAVNDGNGGFSAATRWINAFGSTQGYPSLELYPREFADVNGDGSADIIGFSATGVILALSTGSSFVTTGDIVIPNMGVNAGSWDSDNPRITADVNGDGFADIVAFSNNNTLVYLNDRAGGFANATASAYMSYAQGYRTTRHPRVALDINFDGLDDVLAYANPGTAAGISNGNTLSGSLTSVSPDFGHDDGWRIGNDPRMLADINGDNLPDIVGFGPERPNVPGGVYYALNTGNAAPFAPRRLWVANYAFGLGSGYTVAENPRFAADVNGDGTADLIVFDDTELVVVFAASVN